MDYSIIYINMKNNNKYSRYKYKYKVIDIFILF